MSLSRSHRLTWTTSRASAGGGGPSAMRPVWCRTVPAVPSRRSKWIGPSGSAPVDQSDGRQDRADRRRIELAVLGRERVDRRRDDDEPLLVDPVRRVVAPREHEGVGMLDVGPEERPSGVGEVVARRRARRDSARPRGRRSRGGPRPCPPSGGRGAARCRGRRSGAALGEVRGEHQLVAGPLGVAERTAVAGVAVQQVVQPLGDGEELGVAVEHEPPVLDVRPRAVGEQRLQHLGDAPAVRGGVDVPDRAIAERGPGPPTGLGELLGPRLASSR